MLEKRAKTSKVQSEKKVKGTTETEAIEPTPTVSVPAASMEGEFFLQIQSRSLFSTNLCAQKVV